MSGNYRIDATGITILKTTDYRGIRNFLVVGAIAAMSACSDSENSVDSNAPPQNANAVHKEITKLVDSIYQQGNVVNTLLTVNDSTKEGSYSVARGLANPAANEAMTAEHQFHIASMTKPFTATLLLQLVDEGHISLETTLGEAFGKTSLAELFPEHSFNSANADGVPVARMTINDIQQYKGISQGDNITIRQLTQHSHGMPDYLFDTPSGSESLAMLTILGSIGAPTPPDSPAPKQWTGVGLLEYYLSSDLPTQSFLGRERRITMEIQGHY